MTGWKRRALGAFCLSIPIGGAAALVAHLAGVVTLLLMLGAFVGLCIVVFLLGVGGMLLFGDEEE